MEVTAIIEVVGMIVVPLVMGLLGYFIKTLNNQIDSNKQTSDREIEELNQELKQAHKREDALREIDRIDKDISNLRTDVKEGFNVLRQQMQEDKKEVLNAIARISK